MKETEKKACTHKQRSLTFGMQTFSGEGFHGKTSGRRLDKH